MKLLSVIIAAALSLGTLAADKVEDTPHTSYKTASNIPYRDAKDPSRTPYHIERCVRGDASPILLITGGREKEMLGRYEENAYLMRMLKVNGHQDVTLYEMQGYGHGMIEPAMAPMKEFMARVRPAAKQLQPATSDAVAPPPP